MLIAGVRDHHADSVAYSSHLITEYFVQIYPKSVYMHTTHLRILQDHPQMMGGARDFSSLHCKRVARSSGELEISCGLDILRA